MKAHRRKQLAKPFAFSVLQYALRPTELIKLAELSDNQRWKADEVRVRPGDKLEAFYVIQDGTSTSYIHTQYERVCVLYTNVSLVWLCVPCFNLECVPEECLPSVVVHDNGVNLCAREPKVRTFLHIIAVTTHKFRRCFTFYVNVECIMCLEFGYNVHHTGCRDCALCLRDHCFLLGVYGMRTQKCFA